MADEYDEAAQRWARGVRAAKPFVDARREAAKAKAIANRATGAKTKCGITDCTRHVYKARLCRKHYGLVPFEEKMKCALACVEAQLRAADKAHSRYLPIAQAIVSAAK